ncbi:cysteine desulfurase [Segetibacter sp. 3557_3]|uniref:aminotransferase class V-fold PLP-dependent enzyme n=1 Tax=Segetibacter sp. 3557_3 TaxID=2547429 RepID=UPI001058762E|nr:cysteine desulfurase [Segetibacter sp. 3557_3]TDH27750.1 cysteine desulfurase [Segetibacter sp. 3557_3]
MFNDNDTLTTKKAHRGIDQIRADFPILQTTVYGHPLVYLDNAATTQKPNVVLKAMDDYYKIYNSNIHRGVHYLSQKATDAFEVARRRVQEYINAKHEHEIIFTKGTTEAINLVASSFGKRYVKPGDTIMISELEHHSNIIPWQLMCEDRGASLKVIPINEKGELKMEAFDALLDETVKLVAVSFVSNTLGTVNPVKEIIEKAHARNIPVMLDAAQAIQHVGIDVQFLDVDFLAFSGHKMYGPTGVGVLYGKESLLNEMPPYQGGGEMIKTVSFEKSTYNVLPFKFEAGTPNVAEVIGLEVAINYINSIGLDFIREREQQLITYALGQLQEIDELRFIGEAAERAASISFLVGDTHPFDVGELLDKQGIAVRTGHHCTEPLMNIFKIPGTVRASFAFYNTEEEIDKLVKGVKKAAVLLG